MKKLYLLFALFIGLSFTNCSSDDPEVPSTEEENKQEENKPVEKVDYYIKYIAKATRTMNISSVTVATDKGTSTYELKNATGWEQTYGPVAKGFKARISIKGYTNTLEIHCCRGKEPFALKAIKNGQTSNPSIEYTIDY